MPIRYTRVGGGTLNGSNYLLMAKQVPQIVDEELSPVGEAAKGEAQGFVAIAGTGHAWSIANGGFPPDRSRAGGGNARIATGQMQRDLDYRVTHGKNLSIDIGWIHNYEDYYGAQEGGFSAGGFRPSQTVEGMGMFQHLRVYVRIRANEAAGRVLERVANGL